MARPKKQNTGTCFIEGCDKQAKAMNMCGAHYAQYRRGARAADGVLLRPLKEKAAGLLCKVEDCSREVIGRGFCSKHYQQWQLGYRSTEGVLKEGVVERNTGSRLVTDVDARRVMGLRAGTCKLCNKPMFHGGTGYCTLRYAQYRRGQVDIEGNELRRPQRVASYNGQICSIPDCSRQPTSHGFCEKHYRQVQVGLIDAQGNKLREPKNHGPRGGKDVWEANRGYLKRRAPGHPHADQYGFVLEHRLVMEEKLGRYLQPHEIVHHKDGNRSNNHPGNLEVLSQRHPDRQPHPPARGEDMRDLTEKLGRLRVNDPESYRKLLEEMN